MQQGSRAGLEPRKLQLCGTGLKHLPTQVLHTYVLHPNKIWYTSPSAVLANDTAVRIAHNQTPNTNTQSNTITDPLSPSPLTLQPHWQSSAKHLQFPFYIQLLAASNEERSAHRQSSPGGICHSWKL